MSFHVIWDPESRKDRAFLWVTAPDPAAVRAACDAVETALGRDPYQDTDHLSEGLWRLVVPPIKVFFDIDPAERQVTITAVDTAP